MERVLVVGATGNIGVAAIIAALRTKRNVLAIVRNQDSAEKLFKHVGTKDGITTVEADVISEDGVQSVVDQVQAGKLPSFQHVYSCVGTWTPGLLHETTTANFRKAFAVAFDSNFFAYRATIPYLLSQNHPYSTWTLCTGAAAEYGSGGITAATQGALWAMTNTAMRELKGSNVRVNEAFLNARVEYDELAERKGVMKASEYAKCYERILENKELDGCRVSVFGPEHLENPIVKRKADWKKEYPGTE